MSDTDRDRWLEPRSPYTPGEDAYDGDLLSVAELELDPWSESNAMAAFKALAMSGVEFQARDITDEPFSVKLPDNPDEATSFLGAIAARAVNLGLVEVVGRVRSKSERANCRKVNLYRGRRAA